ncbi:MAG: hypothetical protein ABEK04_05135, partial [Candidatus Nanohalobium sp.]
NQSTPLRPIHFFVMLLPSLAVFLLLYREKVRKLVREDIKISRITAPLVLITLVTAVIYVSSGITHLRYLYALILPVAYYGAVIWKEVEKEKTIYVFMALNLILGFHMATASGYESPRPYQEAAKELDCMVESDSWVPLNYAGLNAKPPVNNNTTIERLRSGWRVLDFTGDVINTEKERQVGRLLRDKGTYKVYGLPGRCAEPVKADETRIDEYNTAHGTNYTESEFLLRLLTGKQF